MLLFTKASMLYFKKQNKNIFTFYNIYESRASKLKQIYQSSKLIIHRM